MSVLTVHFQLVAATVALLAPRIPNFSLDLIFGVPGQSLDLWRETLARAVALSPTHVDAWFALALTRHDLGDLAGAEAALRQVLGLVPQRAEAEVNLGIVLQDAGRIDEAMGAYGRAFRLREDSFGRIAHALSAANVGRLWLDLDALRTALRNVPT